MSTIITTGEQNGQAPIIEDKVIPVGPTQALSVNSTLEPTTREDVGQAPVVYQVTVGQIVKS